MKSRRSFLFIFLIVGLALFGRPGFLAQAVEPIPADYPAGDLSAEFRGPAMNLIGSLQEPAPASFQRTQFDRVSTSDGLSYPMVTAILQDSQGFMWFGTEGGGLNRYDGYDFTVYKRDYGDPSSHGRPTTR